jgi:hypothetical protein
MSDDSEPEAKKLRQLDTEITKLLRDEAREARTNPPDALILITLHGEDVSFSSYADHPALITHMLATAQNSHLNDEED